MTTYPTSLSNTPVLTDEATLEAALDCLLEHVELEMQGNYSCQTLFEILLRTASKHDSIEHTTQSLKGSPTGKMIHYHLDKLENMEALEHQMNQSLQSRLPAWIAKHKHRLAIDLHLLPYYGKASTDEQPYLYCSQAKSGTTLFFAYATVYGICRNRRVTLAIHTVHRQETLVATLTILLAALLNYWYTRPVMGVGNGVSGIGS